MNYLHGPATTGHHYSFGQILALNALVGVLAVAAFANCIGPPTAVDDLGVARVDATAADHALLTLLFHEERIDAMNAHKPFYGTPAWRRLHSAQIKAKPMRRLRTVDALVCVN